MLDLSALSDNDLIDETVFPQARSAPARSELRSRLASLRQERDRATSDASHAWGPVVHAAERRAVQAERERDEAQAKYEDVARLGLRAVERVERLRDQRRRLLAATRAVRERAVQAEARVRELEDDMEALRKTSGEARSRVAVLEADNEWLRRVITEAADAHDEAGNERMAAAFRAALASVQAVTEEGK